MWFYPDDRWELEINCWLWRRSWLLAIHASCSDTNLVHRHTTIIFPSWKQKWQLLWRRIWGGYTRSSSSSYLGVWGADPLHSFLKRDVVLMLRSLLFQGACALNPSDDEYSKAAKTHSSNSSLSLGKNEPMCKFKYGGSSIIPPMTLILVYIK